MSKTSASIRRSGRTFMIAALVPLAGAAHAQQHTPALAQERDNDRMRDGDIVVTGTKTGDFGAKSGIPIEQVPQSIQVIDAEDIIDRGARTIEDALRAVPSATEDRVLPGEPRTLSVRVAYRFGGARR